MTAPRLVPLAVAVACSVAAAPTRGQIIDRIKQTVEDARETLGDARALRCDVQGVCGEVKKSPLFEASAYESLAVTVFDGTRRFNDAGLQGQVRDAFESAVIENGYLLAAETQVDAVKDRLGRQSPTDAQLAQLKEFVDGVDAVVVVDIRRVENSRCEITRDGRKRYGTEATVHLSARWLNVDAGDVPWVATHKAAVCAEGGGREVWNLALQTAADQLATTLPERQPK